MRLNNVKLEFIWKIVVQLSWKIQSLDAKIMVCKYLHYEIHNAGL
jgi:hypothetical protein